jgi:hypothetical protein
MGGKGVEVIWVCFPKIHNGREYAFVGDKGFGCHEKKVSQCQDGCFMRKINRAVLYRWWERENHLSHDWQRGYMRSWWNNTYFSLWDDTHTSFAFNRLI